MTSPDPRMARATAPVARARDIANVRFVRPDLNRTTAFLGDFGLLAGPSGGEPSARRRSFSAAGGYGPCYIAEQGPRPVFLGFSLAMASPADLEALAGLPGSGPVEPAEDWPEGLQVRLKDPAGNDVRGVFGPPRAPSPDRLPLDQNLTTPRRRLNAMQRPPAGPSNVLRLGHVVINVVDFFRSVRWYIDTFGLIPSDIQTLPDGDAAIVFLRCDRGDEPTDHHTLVLVQNVENGYSHCAFECIDVDDIAMGQEHLLSRGWTHAWGVGRHLLGSQLFDYWRDPWGDKVEHFVDSDMFTAARPTDVTPLTSGGLYQWGPPLPADFEAPRITPAFLWRAIRNVRRSPEMTFARMFALLKIIQKPPRPWARH
ncbi:hypothetical protein KOAAANKH_00766 [Brevundimonas sp. NIBR10]|uniref:VOC family protein n=1 Tax=Brevundimonas sp. NIBR10 TaxID=3015997 RepID=UPI0022F1DABF|nr:VOC family protein [Brevundimonas sp. NIBR10]WGM45901.1 hypothetical protein KOAAANKH_00766 [Brevundimonas sp. NIBR10]